MIRVCTYPDPFTINKNKELWDTMTRYPQFCASQTLVQGMGRYYKKDSFYFIQTAQTLIDNIYGDWTKNFDSDISIYLAVSNYIKTITNAALRSSLKNNISDIVKSIKLLIIMRADKALFDDKTLSFEQKEVLKIYDKIVSSELGHYFDKYDKLNRNDIDKVLLKCLLDDINNYIEREELISVKPAKTLDEACQHLERLKVVYKEKLSGSNFFSAIEENANYKDKIEEVNHYIQLTKDKLNSDTIVFHGIHKITPIMYFLFKTLDRLGINVVFVINYMKNYPIICNTWDKVYAWTKCKFEYVEDLISMYNSIGRSFGDLFEGKVNNGNGQNIVVNKYSNLTQFTDEISTIYNNAKINSKKSAAVLSNMKIQYYAIDSEDSNKILKIYYPEQFGSKHFLTYPIGQFILNMYNMWDTNKKKMIYTFSNLYECINSGLLLQENTSRIFNICKKIQLYFGEEFCFEDVEEKAKSLKDNLKFINSNKDLYALKKLSFYSIEEDDINLFVNYITKLNEIASVLFKDENVNYKNHFRKLIEIVSSMVKNTDKVTDIELQLVDEIQSRLQLDTDNTIFGSIEDIQQAIFYYLSAIEEKDSSNWIVRGFDQIDGGVLLSKSSKSKNYHLALLSNNHLCGAKLQELPYPLTINMFKNYQDCDTCVNVVNEGYKEERNYLRFYLFYALMFTQKNIELSYIETEKEGKTQEMYYAFKALGLNVINKEDVKIPRMSMENEDKDKGIDFDITMLHNSDKELFAICPYKFLLASVLKDKIIYVSDYHVKYYVNNFIQNYITDKYNNKEYLVVEKDIDKDFKQFKKLFPFWLDSEYLDITRKIKEDIERKLKIDKATVLTKANETYKSRKQNFLIAKWQEQNYKGEYIGENYMKFPKSGEISELNKKIMDYMNNDSTHNFEVERKFPHPKVCENCNYVELCLRKYYEVLENEYIDASDNGENE